jgi:hypothetical protein
VTLPSRLRLELERVLDGVDGFVRGGAVFARDPDAPAWWCNGTEVAHFDGDLLDLRIGRKVLSQLRRTGVDLLADPRIQRRTPSSDWIEIAVSPAAPAAAAVAAANTNADTDNADADRHRDPAHHDDVAHHVNRKPVHNADAEHDADRLHADDADADAAHHHAAHHHADDADAEHDAARHHADDADAEHDAARHLADDAARRPNRDSDLHAVPNLELIPDLELVRLLATRTAVAHAPSPGVPTKPPPTGADLDRRRRWH